MLGYAISIANPCAFTVTAFRELCLSVDGSIDGGILFDTIGSRNCWIADEAIRKGSEAYRCLRITCLRGKLTMPIGLEQSVEFYGFNTNHKPDLYIASPSAESNKSWIQACFHLIVGILLYLQQLSACLVWGYDSHCKSQPLSLKQRIESIVFECGQLKKNRYW